MPTAQGTPGHPGPTTDTETPRAERSLAPDLARGMMLLFIALANVVTYLHGNPQGPGHRPLDSTAVDRLTDTLATLFIDSRSYPMFAILVGYGMATMARRATARGASRRQVRALLTRRSLWLIAFGTLHAALLFSGDILAVYGIVGLLAARLVDRGRRTLQRWAAASFLSMTTVLTLSYWSEENGPPDDRNAMTDYLDAATARLTGHLAQTLLFGLLAFLVALFVIGFALARTGLLDHPEQHTTTLRRIAVAALTADVALGLPHALTVGRYIHPDHGTQTLFNTLHTVSGWATGLGYVCLFALLAARIERRHPDSDTTARTATPRPATWISAVGERSLTCYLIQSAVLAPLMCAWGAGLGSRIGTTQAYALAAGTWTATAVLAVALARAGRRGPFEVLLRRLTYR